MYSQETELRELHQNVRQLKHDMKNHLMVLTSYLNSGEYDQAKAYTSELLDKFSTMHSYIETGNVLLNHIINEKLSFAKSQGIPVKAEIENLAFETMNRMDFSALLTNMLDNAVEALLRDKEEGASEKRQMQVIISAQRGYETICVKNQISTSVLAKNPNLETSKEEKDSHGLGVGKIKEIVAQYGGMADFYEEDNFFCVKVFIPK
jgi:sensor histidine kinase regulating citrate/malate metabolism